MKTRDWDDFFIYQATWGKEAREFVYRHTDIFTAEKVLELGCGTGVITSEIASRTKGVVHAIDINPEFLEISKERVRNENVRFYQMDATQMEFENAYFDVVYFANFLMWVKNPYRVFSEIVRVLAPSGYLGILSEPDYGGRIDYPCEAIGRGVLRKLKDLGANPYIGRQIRDLCCKHGIRVYLKAIQGMFEVEDIERAWNYDVVFAELEENERECIKNSINEGSAFLLMPLIYGYGKRV